MIKRLLPSIIVSSIMLTQSAAAASQCTYPGTQGKVTDYYTGPLIDTHLHIPSPIDNDDGNPVLRKDMTMADIACTLKYEGTKSAFSFFPVYVDSPPYQKFFQAVETAKRRYPNRFVRFIMSPGGQPKKTLLKFLAGHDDWFQGYGEVGFHVSSQHTPNDYAFRQLYPVLEKRNMLIYMHPGEDQVESVASVLEQHPDLNVIVHGEQIEQEIGDLMDQYDNIYFTVNDLYGDQYLLHQGETSQSFLDKTDDYETLLQQDLATWQELIESHPNQFLWGTDRGGVAAWTLNRKVGLRIADYGRAFIARLDPDVQELFAYKNAQRLMNSVDD